MQKEQLSYEMLLARSRETGISFSDLLGGAVLEEIVRRISTSEFGENLWLRSGTVLGIRQYKKNLVLTLEYIYIIFKLNRKNKEMTDQMFLTELQSDLSEKVFLEKQDYGIHFEVKSKIQKQNLLFQLVAELGDMQVPVAVKVHLLRDEKKIPKKENFTCMMFPKVTVYYNSYPTEGYLAERFMEIITKLELIQDIGAYYDIYYLLEKESVDGRKVREYIEDKCEELKIPKEKDRLEMIAGYKDYTYMKKKWKVFLRSVNSKEPSWEKTIERFVNFFEPIWRAVLEDRAFFGDWMPDLNRFL